MRPNPTRKLLRKKTGTCGKCPQRQCKMALRPCGTVRRCAREILIVPKRRRRVRDTCDAGSRGHQRTLMGRCHYDLMIVVMTISMKTVIRMLMLVLRTLVLRMRMLWTTVLAPAR